MASKQLVGLSPGTSYAIQIRAVGNGGYSDWSPAYTFVTPGTPTGTTNTSQSMRLANGSVIYAGNPPASALVSQPTVGTGSSALVMANNAFTALKSDGTTVLFKLDIPTDTLTINASNFVLNSDGSMSIGGALSTNKILMDSSGNLTVSGVLTANRVSVPNNIGGYDYWDSTGFNLGGNGGISYNYTTDTITIGSYGNQITVNSSGGVTVSGTLTVGNLTDGVTTISGNNITTGIIKSQGYGGVTDGTNFSTNGTAINLIDGSITGEKFRMDASGNIYMQGNLTSNSTINGATINGGSVTGTYIFTSPGAYGITITGGQGASDTIRFTNTVGDAWLYLGAGDANAFNITGPGQTPYYGGLTFYGTGSTGVPNTLIARNPLRLWNSDPNLSNNSLPSLKSAKNITIAHYGQTTGSYDANAYNGDVHLQYTP